MAFGFGFNKQKVMSAAEKFVQQGKLPNAISEYEKILKADPKDLTVMNTIGDLYSRSGQTDKAAECFKNVGDAYAGQGFTVKAIAMYKKLSKLRSSTECVLRLAELYTQQGLFNDARAQYLQVAEEFLKSGQLDQAVRIFQKTLEMDPDNVAMRTRLAEVYVRMGKKEEAWQLLTAAAESLRNKGQLAAADEILGRMLKLEPGSSYALVLRGRAALESGDAAAAIECLKQVGDLDSDPEGLRTLFQAYLRGKRFEDACGVARKLLNVHNDPAAMLEYAHALVEAQEYREALDVYQEFSEQLLRAEHEKLLEALQGLIRRVKEDPPALETVLGILEKAGDHSHLTEISELLAHAYVQSGNLERARAYYAKLMQLEPANPMHARNLEQVTEKLGAEGGPHLITPEEGALLVDELEATASMIDQRYPDDVALEVRAALTDAELFISYNMPAKALDPLIEVLPKAPRDQRLNQKLAALHTRAGRFQEAAVACRTLESIYHDAGHADEASRYGELAAKYEQRTAPKEPVAPSKAGRPESSPVLPAEPAQSPAVTEFEVTVAAPEPEVAAVEATPPPLAAPTPVAAPIPAVESAPAAPSGLFFHGPSPTAAEPPVVPAAELAVAPSQPEAVEIDLSSEWEQDLSHGLEVPGPVSTEAEMHPAAAHAEPVSAPPAISDEALEEVRFYLGQGMTEQADQALAKLEVISSEAPELQVLRHAVESAKQVAQPSELEVQLVEDLPVEQEAEPARALETAQPWPSEPLPVEHIASELDKNLGDGVHLPAPEMTAAVKPAPEANLAEVNAPSFRAGTLDEFVSDLEASLGADFLPQTPEPAVELPKSFPVPAPSPVKAAAASAGGAFTSEIARPSVGAGQESKPPLAAPPTRSSDLQASVDLSDMFGDLRQELDQDRTSADEDPETHYNLGVAFREMGLLDEAIGELQKVCQLADRGHPFTQIMQTYTWLAQCFLDKRMPEVAARWYQKALRIPSLDQETRTALHYELASSLECAGDSPAALSNFLEVYGSNIDYRDVAERIKALRQ